MESYSENRHEMESYSDALEELLFSNIRSQSMNETFSQVQETALSFMTSRWIAEIALRHCAYVLQRARQDVK